MLHNSYLFDHSVVSDVNDCVIMTIELERMWKGVAVSSCQIGFWTSAEETEENYGKSRHTDRIRTSLILVLRYPCVGLDYHF